MTLKLIKKNILWSFAFIIIAACSSNKTNSSSETAFEHNPELDQKIAAELTQANKSNIINVIEFSDFQCGACRHYSPILKEMKKRLAGKITFSYKHFPLSYHKYAITAAKAAEAARNQNAFDAMHDLLFERQDIWSKNATEETMIQYAQEIGLNTNQFKVDFNSIEIIQRIEKDKQEGYARQVRTTPSLFINGRPVEPIPNNANKLISIIKSYQNNPNRK